MIEANLFRNNRPDPEERFKKDCIFLERGCLCKTTYYKECTPCPFYKSKEEWEKDEKGFIVKKQQ